MTPYGVLVVVALLLALARWRTRIPWLLALCLGAPASAVVVVGGQSVAAFQVVLLAATPLALWTWFRGKQEPFSWPGAGLLVVFVAWCTFITVAGPVFFDGTDVLLPDGGIDEQVADPTPLEFGVSNLAQVVYLGLSALLICLFAGYRRLSPHLLAPGLGVAMLLSLWRLGSEQGPLPFPTTFFDNSVGIDYIDGAPGGGYRLRGVFPEPSTLALYSIGTLAYVLAMVPRTRGWTRIGYLALAAAAGTNLFWARSGTALVAGGTVLALALVVALVRAVRHGIAVMPVAFATCVAAAVALAASGRLLAYAGDLVGEKVVSSSYSNRTGADVFSLGLFLDSGGLGLGLGSNRPSSLWPMLLSCTGLVGTLLYAALILTLVVRTARLGPWRPVVWALVAVTVTKSVAGSTLSDPLMMLSLGLCAHAVARARDDARDDARDGDGEAGAAEVPEPVGVSAPRAG